MPAKRYLFHQSAVQGEGMDNLREGDSVEFDVGQDPRPARGERPPHLHLDSPAMLCGAFVGSARNRHPEGDDQ